MGSYTRERNDVDLSFTNSGLIAISSFNAVYSADREREAKKNETTVQPGKRIKNYRR